MIVSRSGMERVCIEFDAVSTVTDPSGYLSYGVALGRMDGQMCSFFCIGDANYQIHSYLRQPTECIVDVKAIHVPFSSPPVLVTFYVVLRILGVKQA